MTTQPGSSRARPWTGRFNRRMIRSGPWSAAMDVGGWLRSLGLGQYEALFRASEIDADILPELTDVDLEKLGVPLGHRKRLFRAISGFAAAEPLAAPSVSTSASVRADAERSSSDQFATASANLLSTTPANASPAQAAAQSNPHRPRTAHQPPRVPSSEAFVRRPSPRLYRSTTGRHPKPFTIAVIRQTTDLGKPEGIRPGDQQLASSFVRVPIETAGRLQLGKMSPLC